MKARVHFKTPDVSGSFELEAWDQTYKEWVLEVGRASAETQGHGYFVGDQLSFPFRYITRIQKLED